MGLKVTGRAGKAPCIRTTHTQRMITGNHWNKKIMFLYVMLANMSADFTPNLSILILEQWERTSSKCSKLCRETKGALSGIFWTRLGKLNPKLNYQLPPPPSKTNKGKKTNQTNSSNFQKLPPGIKSYFSFYIHVQLPELHQAATLVCNKFSVGHPKAVGTKRWREMLLCRVHYSLVISIGFA